MSQLKWKEVLGENKQFKIGHTLQLEQTNIGFSKLSERLHMSHDLGCSLGVPEESWNLSEYPSDIALGTSKLGLETFARGTDNDDRLPRTLPISTFN